MDPPLSDRIAQAAQLIQNAHYLVAFTGAGISTESGIPDFRGPDGVWTRRDKGLPPPRSKKPWNQIEPNVGHMFLVELYQRNKLKFLISQNTDNLHRKSGIPLDALAELHGNHTLMRCLPCKKLFEKAGLWEESKWGEGYLTQPVRRGQPVCPECGGRIVSSVINFGDPMPERDLELSFEHARKSDVFLVIGSSLKVVPAAHIPAEAKKHGATIIIINHQETGLDDLADLRFYESAGEVLSAIIKKWD